jgi:hypothetical protein
MTQRTIAGVSALLDALVSSALPGRMEPLEP